MDKKCIQEVTRQLCHPEIGLPANKSLPNPKSLLDWKKCLEDIDGWVNLSISNNMAKVFLHLKIGEVIPSGASNLDFYTFGFATTEIQKFLMYRKHNDKTHILILNYYSFSRFINILLQNKSKEYCIGFHKSIKNIFRNCSENVFWVHIPICEYIKHIMEKHHIGEIIINNDYTREHIKNNNTYTDIDNDMNDNVDDDVYDDVDDDVDDDVGYNMNDDNDTSGDIDIDELSTCIKNTSLHVHSSDDNKRKKRNIDPYRIIMNNKSLLYFLELSCKIHDIPPTSNIFESVGSYDNSLEDLFGSLTI